MNAKRMSVLLMAGLTAASILSGCGSSPDSKEKKETDASEVSQPVDLKSLKTEIVWWAFPTMGGNSGVSGQYEQSVIDAFNEKYPNITVQLEMIDFQNGPEKIATSIQGGTAPDIIFDAPGRIVDWGKAGVLAPLDDLFTEEYLADLSSERLASSCTDGKTYWMYPLSAAPFTMAFDGAVLEKEGLMDMIPTDGDRTWTTEEFKALSKALAEKGYKGAEIYCGAQGGDQGTRAFITNLYGASVTDETVTKYTMDTEEAVKGMQFCLDGIEEGWLTPNTAGVANDALDHFDQGHVVSTVLWGPGLHVERTKNLEASGVKPISVCLPSDDGVPELEYLVNGFCVFDNDDADKIAASKEFIKFVCDDAEWGPKNVVATGCFPVRNSFGDLYPGDEEMAFYAGLSKYYSVYYNTVDGFASMRPFWWGSLQAALTGEKTAQEAMEYFNKNANNTIKEAK